MSWKSEFEEAYQAATGDKVTLRHFGQGGLYFIESQATLRPVTPRKFYPSQIKHLTRRLLAEATRIVAVS